MITLSDKLDVVDGLIDDFRWAREPADGVPELDPIPIEERRTYYVLRAIAKDLRGRQRSAPGVAEHELARRIAVATRGKTTLGYPSGPMIALANEVIGRWATVKQALERFGALEEAER